MENIALALAGILIASWSSPVGALPRRLMMEPAYDLTPGSDPFLVIIGDNKCVGVLIHEYMVVTAATCVNDWRGQPVSVKAGYQKDQLTGQISYGAETLIRRVCVPTQFGLRPDGGHTHNYAMIFLNSKMPIIPVDPKVADPLKTNSYRIKPLDLFKYDPSDHWFKDGNKNCFMLGGGKSNLIPKSSVGYNEVIIRDCVGKPDSSVICFRLKDDRAGVACPGDQGGPILCHRGNRRELVGIVSRVSENCQVCDARQNLMEASYLQSFINTTFYDCIKYFTSYEIDLNFNPTTVGPLRR